MRSCPCRILFALVFSLAVATPVAADLPWQFDNNTRYMALGDSLVAGYGAVPATQGYVYLLYKDGAFDRVTNTLLSNAGVPGVTSRQVLEHQVPQAIEAFRPTVITLTVGGNDLLRILKGENAGQVLSEFQANFTLILQGLRTALPNARIVVSNLYTIPQIPGAGQVVPIFNQIVAGVASAFNVPVADVYSAFQGRHGLLLIERAGAAPDEVHPTNAGYRVMAQAFEAAIR
ncbi:MAG TPA: SGNH/GDSL hydrolase family protein [Acidiferrobacterales bacterium]|nr:SGNH/GDSL hydrolase family protein [Acidiferrobacterales bacterium]